MVANRDEMLRTAAHSDRLLGGMPVRQGVAGALGFLALVTVLGLASAGCVSKSRAEAQSRIAYLAGQRDAYMQMHRHRATPP